MSKRLSIWSENRPLNVYHNKEKIDDLLGRIWGELITEYSKSDIESNKIKGEFKAKIGNILGLLGIGEIGADYGFEHGNDTISSKTSSLTYDNKISILEQYFNENENKLYINVYDGLELIEPKEKDIPLIEWKTKPLNPSEKSFIGFMLGFFIPIRIEPPPSDNTTPISDIMSKSNSLWKFKSIDDSKFEAIIPWISSNFRRSSQTSIMALSTLHLATKVEVFGLISFDGNSFLCDPISFRIFH